MIYCSILFVHLETLLRTVWLTFAIQLLSGEHLKQIKYITETKDYKLTEFKLYCESYWNLFELDISHVQKSSC